MDNHDNNKQRISHKTNEARFAVMHGINSSLRTFKSGYRIEAGSIYILYVLSKITHIHSALSINTVCWYSARPTSSSSHWKLTCSRHDIAEKLLHSLTKTCHPLPSVRIAWSFPKTVVNAQKVCICTFINTNLCRLVQLFVSCRVSCVNRITTRR